VPIAISFIGYVLGLIPIIPNQSKHNPIFPASQILNPNTSSSTSGVVYKPIILPQPKHNIVVYSKPFFIFLFWVQQN
jgi:hypothetical protein